MAFSPDGKVLATESNGDDCIRLSDAATGNELRRIKRISSAESAREWRRAPAIFSPDGRTLASPGTSDGVIYLYETATGQCRHELRGHVGGVSQVAYSADGRRLVSGGHDSTALLWNLSAPPECGAAANKPEALWDELASSDAKRGYGAVRALSAGGAATAALFRTKLRPAAPADPKRLKKLINDLNNDDFEVREAASADLARLSEMAAPALEAAVRTDTSAETRRRAGELLDGLTEAHPSPQLLRTIRAVETLERMNTPEARDILKSLAAGALQAHMTQEAKATLDRLAKRPDAP